MSESIYDVIVAGTGTMGASACYYLAKSGCKVLGLEQFESVPHEYGSHAGQSRIIRKAYFEHPDYVPLLQRAYNNWYELEQLTGEKIFFKTGLLYCGPHDHEVIKGVKEAAAKYKIELTKPGFTSVVSAFKVKEGDEMLLEPDAGFLLPEKSIALYLKEAVKKGAEIRTGEKVLDWKREAGIIKITTGKNSWYARKLVITAGAWAKYLTGQISGKLKVTRQVIVWVKPETPELYTPENFPCWVIAGNDIKGVWYGFPYLSGERFPGPSGMKFALHHAADESYPDNVNRDVPKTEIRKITADAGKYFVPAGAEVAAVKTCLYTNTPDENFIIDHLPGYDGDVTIACGFSGHGFKFASAVGEVLADLTLKGTTDLPAGFLGLKRFEQSS